jgi:hypothetical protein
MSLKSYILDPFKTRTTVKRILKRMQTILSNVQTFSCELGNEKNMGKLLEIFPRSKPFCCAGVDICGSHQ